MFRLIIGIVAVYLIYRLIRKSIAALGEKPGPQKIQPADVGEELVEDPFCHAYVPLSQAIRREIGGQTVYFCSRKCLEQYEKQ